MNISDFSPDDVELWQWGFASLNYTILYTWLVMALLVFASWLITRRLTSSKFGAERSFCTALTV